MRQLLLGSLVDRGVAAAASALAQVVRSPWVRKPTTYLRGHITTASWRARLGALGPGSKIYPHVIIHGTEQVRIGADVEIAEFVHIWGGGGVTIGDHARIAAGCVITSQTHDTEAELFGNSRVTAPVQIERRAWLGSGVILMPGVTIGEGAIVAAGAVVTKDVPPGVTVAGVPARPLERRHE